jgi:hypothetical protein
MFDEPDIGGRGFPGVQGRADRRRPDGKKPGREAQVSVG